MLDSNANLGQSRIEQRSVNRNITEVAFSSLPESAGLFALVPESY